MKASFQHGVREGADTAQDSGLSLSAAARHREALHSAREPCTEFLRLSLEGLKESFKRFLMIS